MWRYWVGAAAAILLVVGGVFWWRSTASAQHRTARHAAATTTTEPGDEPIPEPPAASEKTREEKRFLRSDHDKNGAISRDEFLAARRRNFAKLDVNGANYLVAHDTNKAKLYSTGLPMKELTTMIKDRIHSDRVLVLLDACHSGAGIQKHEHAI